MHGATSSIEAQALRALAPNLGAAAYGAPTQAREHPAAEQRPGVLAPEFQDQRRQVDECGSAERLREVDGVTGEGRGDEIKSSALPVPNRDRAAGA